MFWGLILRANKRYSQTVTKTFHLSQATLDVSQTTTDADVQVLLASENENYILCTLSKKKDVLQVPLDLVFSEGDDISFSCVGGVVHLTGYLVPNDEFDGFGGEEGDSDLELGDEEEEENAQSPPKKLSKKQEALKKLLEAEHGDDSDEDDSDVDLNGLEEEEGDDSDDDEELEDEEDDDDEDIEDDDSEEEEVAEPVAKKQKQQNGAAPVNGKAPKAEKPVAAPVAAAQPAKAKTLSGGVKVEDIRVGKGLEAKAGKSVQVYYEGRLQSSNKVFDSTKIGKGFTFKLGKGEVIRGWDVGVAGMKVGSKRRITCPPAMAYGAKGALPTIPPNATLVFEVELRGVK